MRARGGARTGPRPGCGAGPSSVPFGKGRGGGSSLAAGYQVLPPIWPGVQSLSASQRGKKRGFFPLDNKSV